MRISRLSLQVSAVFIHVTIKIIASVTIAKVRVVTATGCDKISRGEKETRSPLIAYI